MDFFFARLAHWNYSFTAKKLFLRPQTLKDQECKQKKFDILWSDYPIETFFGRYYIFFTLLRNSLMVAILYGLPQAPLAQAYLLLFLSIFYIIMLANGRPFKKTDLLVSAIVTEIFLLLAEVIV